MIEEVELPLQNRFFSLELDQEVNLGRMQEQTIDLGCSGNIYDSVKNYHNSCPPIQASVSRRIVREVDEFFLCAE